MISSAEIRYVFGAKGAYSNWSLGQRPRGKSFSAGASGFLRILGRCPRLPL